MKSTLRNSLKDALVDDLKAKLGDKFDQVNKDNKLEDVLDPESFNAESAFDKISSEVKIRSDTKSKIEKLLKQYKLDFEMAKSKPLVGINALDLIQKTKLYRDYYAKSLLIKMMIMESAFIGLESETQPQEEYCDDLKFRLPIITKAEHIDMLYNDFGNPAGNTDKPTTVRKAYEIMETCHNNLENGEKYKLLSQIAISDMLYDYAEGKMKDVTEASPNVIYYGAPGTGKTFKVEKGIMMITKSGVEDNERVVWIQCHPGFGYEEFIEGLKPVGFTENGTIKLEIVNGEFKNLCIRAKNALNNGLKQEYFFVADEINRANLSAMFGETLSLLETGYRDYKDGKRHTISTPMSKMTEAYINSNIEKWIPKDEEDVQKKNYAIIKQIKKIAYECNLVYDEKENGEPTQDGKPNVKIVEKFISINDKELIDPEDANFIKRDSLPKSIIKKVEGVKFGVPKNIRFIGMMNDVDKSIDAFDLALRRRFKWIRKDCDYDALERALVNAKVDEESISQYCEACKKLNNFISGNADGGLGFGKSYEFGHAYFMIIKTYLDDDSELKSISLDNRKDLFNEHLAPVLKEYIRSFKDDSEIDKCIKEAKKKFTTEDEAAQSTAGTPNDTGTKTGANNGK